MKHWEVLEFINGYHRQRARDLLALTDAVKLGAGMMGGEDDQRRLWEAMAIQAGYKQKKSRIRKDHSKGSWTEGLLDF